MHDDATEPFAAFGTARLRLRCVQVADAAALSALMTPAVSTLLAAWPVPFTPDMARDRIAAARAAAFAGTALPCAVERRGDGAFLGWAGVGRTGRRGMLGYWLGEAHHGQGLMREAASAVVAAAFRVLDLDVIEAAAQPGNAASFAVMRGCGMVPAGERMILAPARDREERCLVYEIGRQACVTLPPG